MSFARWAARGATAMIAAVTLTATCVVAAPQASAGVECRPAGVCLYYSTGFNDMKFVTQRVGGCYWLGDYGLSNHVWSYDNNLAVTVYLLGEDGKTSWRIRPGGSSQDSRPFGPELAVCVGFEPA